MQVRIISKTVRTLVINKGELGTLSEMINEASSTGNSIRLVAPASYFEIEVAEYTDPRNPSKYPAIRPSIDRSN